MTTNKIRGGIQILDNSISEDKLDVANVPASGQRLAWDGTDLRWENVNIVYPTYYLHEENADVGGYEQLLPVPANSAEVTDSAVCNSGTGDVLIDAYITDALGVEYINGGAVTFNTYCRVDSAVGTTTIQIKVYKRNTLGTETLLFSTATNEINNTTVELNTITYVMADAVIDPTDRIVVKYYANTTSVVDRTVYLYYEGTENYSHIHTPFVSSPQSFLGLTDTPNLYTTAGGYVVSVKTDETGLEFGYPVSSGGGVSSLVLANSAGGIRVQGVTSTAKSDLAGVVRINANTDFTTGKGLELGYTEPNAYITAYDRDASAYETLNLRGSNILATNGDVNISKGLVVGNTTTDPDDAQAIIEINDGLTNSQARQLILRHNSTGTPTANFGSQIHFQGESTTTENRDMASIGATWATATDASRLGQLHFYSRHYVGLTEGLRVQAITTAITDVVVPNGDIYSNEFTNYYSSSTVVGWTGALSNTSIYYKRVGRTIFVSFYLGGTSNSSTVTFTLPYNINTAMGITQSTCRVQDNGTWQANPGLVSLSAGNTVTISKDLTGAGFTTSGTKTVIGQFFYEKNA